MGRSNDASKRLLQEIGSLVYDENMQFISVRDEMGLSAFGEKIVVEETPIVQPSFIYNVNSQQMESRLNNGGAISQANSMAVATTGASANAKAEMRSLIPLKYDNGQGAVAKFTGLFTTGKVGSEQFVGVGGSEDALGFGYDGADFGLLHRHNGVQEIRQLIITTAAVTANGDITITLDGDAQAVTLVQNDTVEVIARKIVAEDWAAVGTGWDAFVSGDTVQFISFETGALAGAFTFVDTDTTGAAAAAGVTEILSGGDPTDDWVKQADWNVDKMDGSNGPGNLSEVTLNPTKLNVYKVQYQYLGAGAIELFVEDPSSGMLIKVHVIQYANANTVPSFGNPTLPLNMYAQNVANATSMITKTGSMAAFTQGKIDKFAGIPGSATVSKAAYGGTTEAPILTIRNKPVFQTKQNKVRIELTSAFIDTDGTKAAIFRFYKNSTLNDNAAFTDVGVNTHVTEFDIACDDFTAGTLVEAVQIAKVDRDTLSDILGRIQLSPGEILTVSVEYPSAPTADLNVTLNWREKQ